MKFKIQLDGLRFVAVSLVLIEHFAYSVGKHFSAGFYGVNLFFVLSGFLITNILLNTNESFGVSYKNFIGRRTIRIFPIYYITIFTLYLLNNQDIHDWLIYCISYTYNYAWNYHDIKINSISHLWSLSVEEQFYLLWPFLVLGFRNKTNWLVGIIILTLIISGIQICKPISTNFLFIKLGLIPQCYALCFGALGSIFFKKNNIPDWFFKSKQIEISMLVALLLLLTSTTLLKQILCPIISLFIIWKAAKSCFATDTITRFLSNKHIAYIGSISYGIYLYHLPLGHYMDRWIFDPIWTGITWSQYSKLGMLQWNSWIIKLPLYFILSIALAHLSYKYLESPLLALKDKWFKYKTE
jgi:peptidoglycan/LPS O-acetylase OafA/YrhL